MQTCFILCRQSSYDGDNSLSLEKQEEECRKLAVKEDLTIVKAFHEPGFSGRLYPEGFEAVSKTDFILQEFVKNTPKENMYRPGLGEILKRLDEVQYVVVYDVTRLMRPLNGSFLQNVVIQALIKSKVRIWSVKEGIIDYSKFQDSLFSSLTSQINSEQLLIQRQKAMEARKKSQDKGEYANGLYHIIGYRYLNKNLGFVKDEIGSEIVKYVADAYVEKDVQPVEIAREIVKRWPVFYEKNKLLYPTRFITQICNPLYAGYCFNTENQLIPFRQLQGKEIYSLETYFKFRKKLDLKKLSKTRASKGFYPLTSKMECSCGCGMYALGSTFWNGKRLMKYVCNSYRTLNGAKGCGSNIQISYDTADGLSLHSCIKPLLIVEILRRMEISLKNADTNLDLKNAELKLNDLTSKEKKLTELYLSDMLSESVYTEKIKSVREEKKRFEEIRNSMLAPRHSVGLDEQLKLLLNIQNGNISNDDFADLCSDFIKKIVSKPDCLEVTTAAGMTIIRKNIVSRGVRMFNFELGFEFDYLKNGLDFNKVDIQLVWYAGKKRTITVEEFKEKARFVQKLGRVSIYEIR